MLCEHNPNRRCCVNFAPKYLVSDFLHAKCDAPIRVEVIDRSTGQIVNTDFQGISLELCILDGNQYDLRCAEHPGEDVTGAELDACCLSNNNKLSALLVPGPGGTLNSDNRVVVPLTGGIASLPDLHVTDSSEALLSGRKPPFRLLVRAVRNAAAETDGAVVMTNVPAIDSAVSEGFVVATRRTRTAGKAEIPNVDDHVGKLEHMGRETVKKLQDIRGSALHSGVDIQVPDNCVNRVGEFRQLALLAEADGHLRQKLQQVLKLSKEKWDEARDHALRAVVADNRMRIWYADKRSMDVGLLFTCRLGSVDLDRPVGLLTKKASDGSQTTMEATLMAQQTPAQREQVRALQPQGVATWWEHGHPGWAIYPVDSEHFLATGALDALSLPQMESGMALMPPMSQPQSTGGGGGGNSGSYPFSNSAFANAYGGGGDGGGGGEMGGGAEMGGGGGGGGAPSNDAVMRPRGGSAAAAAPYMHHHPHPHESAFVDVYGVHHHHHHHNSAGLPAGSSGHGGPSSNGRSGSGAADGMHDVNNDGRSGVPSRDVASPFAIAGVGGEGGEGGGEGRGHGGMPPPPDVLPSSMAMHASNGQYNLTQQEHIQTYHHHQQQYSQHQQQQQQDVVHQNDGEGATDAAAGGEPLPPAQHPSGDLSPSKFTFTTQGAPSLGLDGAPSLNFVNFQSMFGPDFKLPFGLQNFPSMPLGGGILPGSGDLEVLLAQAGAGDASFLASFPSLLSGKSLEMLDGGGGGGRPGMNPSGGAHGMERKQSALESMQSIEEALPLASGRPQSAQEAMDAAIRIHQEHLMQQQQQQQQQHQ